MNNEIRNLIFQVIDQTISSQDFDRLQDLMEGDEEVRKEYLRAVNLCETLEDIRDAQPTFRFDSVLANQAEPRESVVELPDRNWGSQAFGYMGVAACAILLTAATLYLIRPWNSDIDREIANATSDNGFAAQPQDEDPPAAKVVQRIDCVMQQEKWSVTSLFDYQVGQSVLVSEGLAVLEFKSGARVTLQGPAALEIVSGNSGFLHAGKLTAVVPDSAIGFEILTPTSRLIDHGTEFGVSVDANGNSETHVFEGEVELISAERKLQNETTNPDSIPETRCRLKDSMAMRVRLDADAKTESIPAVPKSFIRLPGHPSQSEKQLKSITDLPQQDNLVMWFEASQGMQLDTESRVISWQNLASVHRKTTGSESESGSQAWQVNAEFRPRWETKRFADRPAIRFGGYESKEFLATTPIQTGKDTTAMIVCSLGQVKQGGYGHLMVLDGQSKIVMVRRKLNIPGAFSWSWNKNENPRLRIEKLEPDFVSPVETPFICAVRYSQDANTFELFVNGQLISSGNPVGSAAAESSHIIGRGKKRGEFFAGSIAEIVVYDHMLDQDAFDTAMSVLMKKYEIDSTSE